MPLGAGRVALEGFGRDPLLDVPQDHVPTVLGGREGTPVGAEGSGPERLFLAPRQRPHPSRGEVEQAKAPVGGRDRGGAPVGTEGVDLAVGVAADDAKRFRVDRVGRPVGGDQEAPVRAHERHRVGRLGGNADGLSERRAPAGVVPTQEEGVTVLRRGARPPRADVGDEQASSVRSVDDDAEVREPLAGACGMAAKRGRAAHPPSSRVENLQRPRCRGGLHGGRLGGEGERIALRIEGEGIGRSGRLMNADYLVSLGVEQGHGAASVADREGSPVGAQCERVEPLAARAEDADRRGAAKQRR